MRLPFLLRIQENACGFACPDKLDDLGRRMAFDATTRSTCITEFTADVNYVVSVFHLSRLRLAVAQMARLHAIEIDAQNITLLSKLLLWRPSTPRRRRVARTRPLYSTGRTQYRRCLLRPESRLMYVGDA